MNENEQIQADALSEAAVPEQVPLAAETLEALRHEAESLRAELAAERRVSVELREFCALYPETATETIPEAVWEKVRGGIPLAAAYALHERRALCARRAADAAADAGRARSSGALASGGGEMPFTPDEVRAMSPDEVRQNYAAIVASMKRW